MKTTCLSLVVLLVSAALASESVDNMKAYPAAEEGTVRYVLHLPPQDDETVFKVELIAGKTVEVDAVNHFFFGGKIEEETIQGWGFPRYVVSKLGPMAGTLIGVDPNEPKVARFISLGGEPFIIRYNSRLPIVVYAPDGVELRYRIWKTEPEASAMEQG